MAVADHFTAVPTTNLAWVEVAFKGGRNSGIVAILMIHDQLLSTSCIVDFPQIPFLKFGDWSLLAMCCNRSSIIVLGLLLRHIGCVMMMGVTTGTGSQDYKNGV